MINSRHIRRMKSVDEVLKFNSENSHQLGYVMMAEEILMKIKVEVEF